MYVAEPLGVPENRMYRKSTEECYDYIKKKQGSLFTDISRFSLLSISTTPVIFAKLSFLVSVSVALLVVGLSLRICLSVCR